MVHHRNLLPLSPRHRVRFWILASLLATTLGIPPGAHADGANVSYPALEVCDPAYYDVLEKKAWMETQRELQVNQTVITKPASTLALSCFDQQLSQAASSGKTFSDTTTANTTQNAINAAIGSSFSQYVADNFKDPTLMTGTTFQSNGNYEPCNRLNTMWAAIKCGTADPTANALKPLDYFRVSADKGGDIRDKEGLANCAASAPGLSTYYEKYMPVTTDLFAIPVAGGKTYFDKAAPDFCSYNPKTGSNALGPDPVCQVSGTNGAAASTKKCSDMNAVPTGVIVSYTEKVKNIEPNTDVWSYACLNPGCYFDVSANFSNIKFSSNATPPAGLKCASKPY